MPYVLIQVTDEDVTPSQKADLIQGVTELVVRVLHKDPALIFVVIDEINSDGGWRGYRSLY